jgi:hypothetical protein
MAVATASSDINAASLTLLTGFTAGAARPQGAGEGGGFIVKLELKCRLEHFSIDAFHLAGQLDRSLLRDWQMLQLFSLAEDQLGCN